MIGPIETLLWMLAAVVKFVLTPSLMIGWGVNWGMTVATCSVGAAFGVYVFFYFGKWDFHSVESLQEKESKETHCIHSRQTAMGSVSKTFWTVGFACDIRVDFCSDFGGLGCEISCEG